MAEILLKTSLYPPRARARYFILKGIRERERERERKRERNVRSGHSSTVSGLHEREPLSIGWLLRNLPLLASYIWFSCPVPFPLLLPVSFPIPCSPLANFNHFFLDRPSWIPWRISPFCFIFLFDSPPAFLFSSNRSRRIEYDRTKWWHYRKFRAI